MYAEWHKNCNIGLDRDVIPKLIEFGIMVVLILNHMESCLFIYVCIVYWTIRDLKINKIL